MRMASLSTPCSCVHGSLEASRPGVSRASLTAHYLAESAEMLQFHTRVRRQAMTRHNGMAVGLLHDQDRARNRLVRTVAWRAPDLFGAARRLAILAVVAARRARNGVAAAPDKHDRQPLAAAPDGATRSVACEPSGPPTSPSFAPAKPARN